MAAPKRPRRRGFTPFRPPVRPPSGSYDPALDASVRASDRGLNDLRQDTEQAGARSLTDYTTANNRIDYTTGNSLSDLLRGNQRETADYQTNTQGLARQFQQLATSQGEAANAAGVLNSGWAQQAAAKRAQNQGIAQSGLDTGHGRALEDYGIGVQRTGNAADMQRGDLTLDYQRGGEDRQTAEQRATREHDFYAQDIGESRWFGARAAGYVPPTRPANEHHIGNIDYRTLKGGRTVSADGTVRTRAQLQKLLRRRGLLH